jgi:hypothetical protein
MAIEWSGLSPEPLVRLDRSASQPLRAQLEASLREAISGGRLRAGERLPSSRELARELGVSRGIVQDCYGVVRLSTCPSMSWSVRPPPPGRAGRPRSGRRSGRPGWEAAGRWRTRPMALPSISATVTRAHRYTGALPIRSTYNKQNASIRNGTEEALPLPKPTTR